MVSLDQQCASVSTLIASCVLRDEHWQAFGYRKRPKRGKLFNAFVNPNKLEQERTLIKELWAAAVVRVFQWALRNKGFDHRIHFMARLMNLCIDGLGEPLWPTFHFSTSREALAFLYDACLDYGSSQTHSDFPAVFLERCAKCLDISPAELPKMWVLGAAWLFSHPSSLLMSIAPALDETVGKNSDSDIDIADTEYYEVAEMTFGYLEDQ